MKYHVRTPISEGEARSLRIGDVAYISGTIVTARDAAHRRMLEYHSRGLRLPVDLRGGVIYHCGPVVSRKDGGWAAIAAGPTTSARMELYEAEVIEKFGVRAIVGKGGMGAKTARACRDHGAVYLVFTGGAAVLAAAAVKKVVDVEWLDLGVPEALWVFEVEDFGPLLVAIDSTGRNLVEEVLSRARRKRDELFGSLGT